MIRGKSRHKGRIWRSHEIKTFMELIIRVIFVVLISASFSYRQFHWSWIWIIPIVLASILNTILAIKTPMHRPIDVILAVY